jgi:hypothetical protein
MFFLIPSMNQEKNSTLYLLNFTKIYFGDTTKVIASINRGTSQLRDGDYLSMYMPDGD